MSRAINLAKAEELLKRHASILQEIDGVRGFGVAERQDQMHLVVTVDQHKRDDVATALEEEFKADSLNGYKFLLEPARKMAAGSWQTGAIPPYAHKRSLRPWVVAIGIIALAAAASLVLLLAV